MKVEAALGDASEDPCSVFEVKSLVAERLHRERTRTRWSKGEDDEQIQRPFPP